MTLDYDRLRDTLRNLDAPESGLAADAQCDLYEHAEEITRELLALRDEIERTRDRITDEIERTPVELQSARINIENGLIIAAHDERTEGDTPEKDAQLWPEPGQIKFLNPAAAEDLGEILIAAAKYAKRGQR